MLIQDVAARTGISAHTIRFYEKFGVLPPIERLPNGRRQFSEADVVFLRFLSQMKQTGMSLEDITAFTEDGCMLERLQRGDQVPHVVARKRLALLRQHQQRLRDQQRTLDALLLAVEQKLAFYERYQDDPTIPTP